MNLKKETLQVLKDNGKSTKDIRWVGGSKYAIPTELFWKLADAEYDDGYGAQEVAKDLVVVGDDWWLERAEYDGSEWWEFKTFPVEPLLRKTVVSVIGGMWWTLEEIERRYAEWEKENENIRT